MNRSPISIAIVAAAVLTLAACSATPQSAARQVVSSVGAPAVSTTEVATTAPVGADNSAITAQGTGIVTGTPDVVTVTLGVETNSTSATAALDDNNKRAAAVIAVLKKSGVAAADLQTSQLSINPSFDNKGQITGYQVTNMVTAKLRKIDTAGTLIDAVGKAAGNAVRVQQLAFSIDNDSALRAKARADAVKQAQAQAKQMADAAGVKLGSIQSITENPVDNSVKYAADQTFAASSAAVPIASGSQELTVSVQVVYKIAN